MPILGKSTINAVSHRHVTSPLVAAQQDCSLAPQTAVLGYCERDHYCHYHPGTKRALLPGAAAIIERIPAAAWAPV